MGFKKAMIYIYAGHNNKNPKKIQVLFNPNSYTITDSSNYSKSDIPGKSTPFYQYKSGGDKVLSMELFFDTYEKGEDVRKYTKEIQNLLKIDKDLHCPPECAFIWGNFKFKGIAKSITQRFTMFLNSGVPVRATINLDIEATKEINQQDKEISKQSSDRTKERNIQQGDQLWMIADREYEDSNKWRHIARANNIDNPRNLSGVNKLTVPPLE